MMLMIIINTSKNRYYRAAGALPQTAEDTIGRNPPVLVSSSSLVGMTLVHLKIEKYRISRTRPIDGSDLVLTEWTPHRKSTHKIKNRSWVCRFPELLLQFYSACGAPMPCAAGSSSWENQNPLHFEMQRILSFPAKNIILTKIDFTPKFQFGLRGLKLLGSTSIFLNQLYTTSLISKHRCKLLSQTARPPELRWDYFLQRTAGGWQAPLWRGRPGLC